MNESKNISYQIIANAYLREVHDSWVESTLEEHQDLLNNEEFGHNVKEIKKLIHIVLPKQKEEIIIGVRYWSTTMRHQFIFPVVSRSEPSHPWRPLELCHFLSLTMREAANNSHAKKSKLDTLVFRCLSSERNMQTFIDRRRKDLIKLNSGQKLNFIESEQMLVIGHQLHPTSKCREGFSLTEMMDYSPETKGKFKLHYFAVQMTHVHQKSALKKSALTLVKEELKRQIAKTSTSYKKIRYFLENADYALIPVHPWQAKHLKNTSEVHDLEKQKAIEYLGALGEDYSATTSIRTVFNKESAFMYKLSLNIRITNSERVNKHWELDRVVETAELLQLPIANEIHKSAPNFSIVNEPAYISVKNKGKVIDGFSCILRDARQFNDENRDISAITSLVQDNPLGGKNRLHAIISLISENENISLEEAAIKWFKRYFSVSIESIITLFIDWGLCFEPHGQNILIEMKNGYPTHCFCRDGQGFFHRQASHKDWCTILPNKGEKTESIFPEELAKERLIYYPFVNQLFSVINTLATQGLTSEEALLRIAKERLQHIDSKESRYPFTLFDVLQKRETLACKGNLLTQLYDMDELVGDIAEQSVYIKQHNCFKNI